MLLIRFSGFFPHVQLIKFSGSSPYPPLIHFSWLLSLPAIDSLLWLLSPPVIDSFLWLGWLWGTPVRGADHKPIDTMIVVIFDEAKIPSPRIPLNVLHID